MSDVRLYAVELRTRDWDRLVDWYRDVAGLRVLVRQTEERFALLQASDWDDGRLLILGRDDVEPDSGRWSLAFEVLDLDPVTARLDDAGVLVPAVRERDEGYSEIVIDDPDGNCVRFFSWPKGSETAAANSALERRANVDERSPPGRSDKLVLVLLALFAFGVFYWVIYQLTQAFRIAPPG